MFCHFQIFIILFIVQNKVLLIHVIFVDCFQDALINMYMYVGYFLGMILIIFKYTFQNIFCKLILPSFAFLEFVLMSNVTLISVHNS